MALSTRIIRTKIRSVQNINKITRAMEMVAASKMRKAIAQAVASREYAEHAIRLLTSLSRERKAEHPLLARGQRERLLVVLVMSDKGLCGGFNAVLSKALARFAERHPDREMDVVAVGRYAERTAKRLNKNLIASFQALPENVAPQDVNAVMRLVQDEFLAGRYERVYLVYNHFVSALSYRPIARKILPVTLASAHNALESLGVEVAEAEEGEKEEYLFEPSVAEVLDIILPRLFGVMIYQGMLESRASEHSARMFAMKNASDNARELIDDLTLTYNHARQDSITQELSEIVGGANALTQ